VDRRRGKKTWKGGCLSRKTMTWLHQRRRPNRTTAGMEKRWTMLACTGEGVESHGEPEQYRFLERTELGIAAVVSHVREACPRRPRVCASSDPIRKKAA